MFIVDGICVLRGAWFRCGGKRFGQATAMSCYSRACKVGQAIGQGVRYVGDESP